jgi:hypothetical protein
MFVNNTFKENPKAEIDPVKEFGTSDLSKVWTILASALNLSLVQDFQLTIWCKRKGKVKGIVFFYAPTELNKVYERLKMFSDSNEKILKIELQPCLKSVFVDM